MITLYWQRDSAKRDSAKRDSAKRDSAKRDSANGIRRKGFGETGFGETGFGETGFGETGFGETGGHRWHMGLRHEQWRLRICIAWREQSVWWWDGCVVCLRRIGRGVRSYTVFWVFRAWMRWWGFGKLVDGDGVGILSVKLKMIGCWPVEMGGGKGEMCGQGQEEHNFLNLPEIPLQLLWTHLWHSHTQDKITTNPLSANTERELS